MFGTINQPTDRLIHPPTHLSTSHCYRRFRVSFRRYIFEYNEPPVYSCAEGTTTEMVYRSIESIRKITDVHHTYFRRAIEDGVLLAVLAGLMPACLPARLSACLTEARITVSDGSLNSRAEGETHRKKTVSARSMSPRRITRCSKQKEKGGKRERERERERERKRKRRRREVPNLKLLRNFDHVVYLELPQSTVKEDLITNYY